ncbi:PEP-CTERM sorting domain-containing protein [Undibacterium sp.]|jgi:hypothetical protein|uniref:PEP-CTERM sorting domain-containing protein n=1 Tax=Undibacterium sp. TaxID=1914977 RepID=UPI002C99ED0C|nr:PEP-CTERM sorting domain-containing protein [Undibacterium sp.]HTD04487.1 PEP-CTERM sorting domain-containing protein [Undibacterium sp.]
MNFLKKAIIGAATALALASSAHASLQNVGGVVWDPDYNAVVEQDFISQFNFTQWFTGSATPANTLDFGGAVGINSVLASLNGSHTGSGYFLQGAGLIYRVNDTALNIAGGLGGGSTFCPGCQLTYAFGGIALNKDSTFDLTNAWAKIYVDSSTVATTPVSGQTVANNYTDGQVWLDLNISSLAFRSGATVAGGFVDAVFQITGGLAADVFDPKVLTYAGSTQFLSPTSQYSTGGNGSVLGNSIPEPGSMALVGLGLLAAGALRRRKAAK